MSSKANKLPNPGQGANVPAVAPMQGQQQGAAPPAGAQQAHPQPAMAPPMTAAPQLLQAAPPPAAVPAAAPAPAPPIVYIGGGVDLTPAQLDAEIDKHPRAGELTPKMRGEIHRRSRHTKQKYILNNTINGLVDGSVKPKSPPPPGAKPKSRRKAAGYINPTHDSAVGLDLLEAGAISPKPPQRDRKDWLLSPSRHFNTYTPTHQQAPVVVQGHHETVFGHGPVDAVDDWNEDGHKRTAAQNKEHNQDPAIYHGLEERKASAKSGGNTESRYRSPSPSIGSDPSHFRRDHPDFDERVPWHSYADQDAVDRGERYVPPTAAAPAAAAAPPPVMAFTNAPPQGAGIVKPIAVPAAPPPQQQMAPLPQPPQQQAAPQQPPAMPLPAAMPAPQVPLQQPMQAQPMPPLLAPVPQYASPLVSTLLGASPSFGSMLSVEPPSRSPTPPLPARAAPRPAAAKRMRSPSPQVDAQAAGNAQAEGDLEAQSSLPKYRNVSLTPEFPLPPAASPMHSSSEEEDDEFG